MSNEKTKKKQAEKTELFSAETEKMIFSLIEKLLLSEPRPQPLPPFPPVPPRRHVMQVIVLPRKVGLIRRFLRLIW